MTFRTKFLLFVSICVPPSNPITACGATSFPGYRSFPKWAMGFYPRVLEVGKKQTFLMGKRALFKNLAMNTHILNTSSVLQ